MKKYLMEFLEFCDYPEVAAETLVRAYEAIEEKQSVKERLLSLLREYGESCNISFGAHLTVMKELSKEAGIHEYTGALLLFILYTRRLEKYYEERGIDRSIFVNSVLDLRYKAVECKLVYGIWGSFVAEWFGGFFNLTRFALGRLQFELIDFKDEYERDGARLVPGDKVINVHIPRTGGRIDKESLDASFKMAAEFYAPMLPDGRVIFYCHSWLLFPRHREMLKADSNVLAFMDRFDIYKSGYYGNYSEAWRLFDMNYTRDHSKLPADSSMRRAYIALFERGEPTGWGKGVYAYSL